MRNQGIIAVTSIVVLLTGPAPALAEGERTPSPSAPATAVVTSPEERGVVETDQPRAKASPKPPSRLTIKVIGLPSGTKPRITVSGQRSRFDFSGIKWSKAVPGGDYTVKAQVVTQGDKDIKPGQPIYVVSTVAGAESTLTIRYGKGTPASTITIPAQKRGDWTSRYQVRGSERFTRSGSLTKAANIRNVPAGWTTIRLTGTQSSLSSQPATFRWNATPGVSLSLRPRIVANSGTLALSLEDVPSGAQPRVVLTSSRGRDFTITKQSTRLPAGTYRVSAPPLVTDGETYLPSQSAGEVQIRAGEKSRLTVNFASRITGPTVTDPDIDVVSTEGSPLKPQRITLRTKAPVNAKVILPVSEDLPGGFVGVVVEQGTDRSVVVERRPILDVVPELDVNYQVSEREMSSALRTYARTYARDADCSVGALFSVLKSTAPRSAVGVLDADLTGINRAGVSLALSSGTDEAQVDFVGSCSMDLPPMEIALPTSVPLWLYFQVTVGTSFTLSGNVEGPIAPSAALEIGVLYDEDTGWRSIFQPTIDLGARNLTGTWTYNLSLPEVSGELGLSPLPRAASGAADLALGVRASGQLGLKGPTIANGERCWGQTYRSYSLDAVARASVLDGKIGGELKQTLYSPDDDESEPFWCLPISDEPVEMAVGNCTTGAQYSLVAFSGAVVPCTDEHTGQTLMVTAWPEGIEPPWVLDELDEGDKDLKAATDANAEFTRECFDAAAQLIGAKEGYWLRTGLFSIKVLGPNQQDWKKGQRWRACDIIATERLSPDADRTMLPIPAELENIARSAAFERFRLCRYGDKVSSTRIVFEPIACSSMLAEYLDFASFRSPFAYTGVNWRSAVNDATTRCEDIGRTYFGITSGVRMEDSWSGALLPTRTQFADIRFNCMVPR